MSTFKALSARLTYALRQNRDLRMAVDFGNGLGHRNIPAAVLDFKVGESKWIRQELAGRGHVYTARDEPRAAIEQIYDLHDHDENPGECVCGLPRSACSIAPIVDTTAGFARATRHAEEDDHADLANARRVRAERARQRKL